MERRATETLRREHQAVLHLLDAAEAEILQVFDDQEARAADFSALIRALRCLHHRRHAAKEEKVLFPWLRQWAVSLAEGPVAIMLEDHREAEWRLSTAEDACQRVADGSPGAASALADNLLGYVRCVRTHIAMEEHRLYPLADRLLLPAAQKRFAEAFAALQVGCGAKAPRGPWCQRVHHLLAGSSLEPG